MKKGFVTWKIRSNPTLSEYLREARQSKMIDIKTAAAKINIRSSYIEDVENGRYDSLPADVYVQGFLKQYVSFLGLDTAFALSLYKRERDVYENVNKKSDEHSPIKQIKNPFLMISPRTLTIISVVVLLAVSFSYLWYQFSSLASPPQLMVQEPGENVVTNSSSIVVNGKTEPESSVLVNGQAIFVDDQGNFNESVSLQAGVNAISVVSRNRLGKEQSITREVMADIPHENTIITLHSDDTTSEKEIVDVPNGVELVVKIENNATWVYVEIDGRFEFQGTMLQDSSQKFVGEHSVSLTTGEAENTRVVFNGINIDELSEDKGPLRDLEFTEDLLIRQRGKIVRKF